MHGHDLQQIDSWTLSSSSGLQLEQLKLLSTAEKLGLFSLAERVLTTDPGAISSASIPFFLAAVGELLLRACCAHCEPWSSDVFQCASWVLRYQAK